MAEKRVCKRGRSGESRLTRTLPAISTRSISVFFRLRSRDLGNYDFASKLSGRTRSSRKSLVDFVLFLISTTLDHSDGNAHDEAVTINKWRRCVRSDEISIQADIWFYKNTNKIRLFTSGIGNSAMRDVTVRDIFPTRYNSLPLWHRIKLRSSRSGSYSVFRVVVSHELWITARRQYGFKILIISRCTTART